MDGGMNVATREQVLAALIEAQGAVSGEWLARRLGITRNSVWKAIARLREEGYAIEGTTNRGYRLIAGRDPVSAGAIRAFLHTRAFGQEIEVHARIDSTNTRAKALAMQGAPHGTLICAREQASGRGRFGRAFYSPAESGVYMSLILRPQLPAERSVLLTSMTAVAVARAIERLADVEVKIKWVNDLFIGDRKVCGILCEAGMDFESGQLEYAVVGIGVNTARAAFPAELAAVATSVGNACGSDVSNNRLIAEICNEMEALYPELASGEFMAESRARSNVIGRRVMVARGEERFTATALDIDEQGGLVVRTEAGVETLRSGEVSIRMEEGQ